MVNYLTIYDFNLKNLNEEQKDKLLVKEFLEYYLEDNIQNEFDQQVLMDQVLNEDKNKDIKKEFENLKKQKDKMNEDTYWEKIDKIQDKLFDLWEQQKPSDKLSDLINLSNFAYYTLRLDCGCCIAYGGTQDYNDIYYNDPQCQNKEEEEEEE